MTEELKPCSRCKSNLISCFYSKSGLFFVECKVCASFYYGSTFSLGTSLRKAIEVWNTLTCVKLPPPKGAGL